MSNTSLAIILLATLALTLVGPSLLQQAKAATSGQNGMAGTPGAQCLPNYGGSPCFTDGGIGGSGNEPNADESSNGNGGNGNNIYACTSDYDGSYNDCSATGGDGGNYNNYNYGTTSYGNGGIAGSITCYAPYGEASCHALGGRGGNENSDNFIITHFGTSRNGNGGRL
jgi:hypothetical protein